MKRIYDVQFYLSLDLQHKFEIEANSPVEALKEATEKLGEKPEYPLYQIIIQARI